MPFNKGKFKQAGEMGKTDHSSKPGKAPAKAQSQTPKNEQGEEQSQAPEHVNQTHPGQTQPHPATGVHAFHAHHKGGGQYTSHTHHGDGTVETQEHPDHGSMQQAGEAALPSDEIGDEMAESSEPNIKPENIGGDY
jgi:hypothetical protein